MTWQEKTLDEAILKAYENGFNDDDFIGWIDAPGNERRALIRMIIENNGIAQIIFRTTFAKALWGEQGLTPYTFHLQHMVIDNRHPKQQDSWLRYLQEHL